MPERLQSRGDSRDFFRRTVGAHVVSMIMRAGRALAQSSRAENGGGYVLRHTNLWERTFPTRGATEGTRTNRLRENTDPRPRKKKQREE